MEKRVWKQIKEFKEILFEEYNGIAKITINDVPRDAGDKCGAVDGCHE